MKTIFTLLLVVICMLIVSVSSFAADQADLSGKMPASSFELNKSATDCAADSFVVRDKSIVLAANCIEKGLQSAIPGPPQKPQLAYHPSIAFRKL